MRGHTAKFIPVFASNSHEYSHNSSETFEGVNPAGITTIKPQSLEIQ